jgi:hypothetical protein
MNYIPSRRKRVPMQAPKPDAPVRCESHLKWVRGLTCVCSEIDPTGCGGKVRACHLRIGTNGGTGMKPGDNWTWPGCDNHHAEQHEIGELTFQKKYRLSLKVICERIWRLSPHRLPYERKQLLLSAPPHP